MADISKINGYSLKDETSRANHDKLVEEVNGVIDEVNTALENLSVCNPNLTYYATDNGSTTAGTWIGTCEDVTYLFDGLSVKYKVTVAGASTTTFNLNGLGAKTVYMRGTTKLTTHFAVGTMLTLIYQSANGRWYCTDYDSDTKTRSSELVDKKMYLIGAQTQSTSGQTTYSNSNCYIGDDNELYSGGKKVAHAEDIPTTGDEIPSYWQTALDEGVEAINTALCEAGRNKSAFLFYTDAHWNYGSQMSPRLLKYLYKHTGMTKTNYGGDIVNNEATDYDTMKYLWEWRNQIKDLPNHHSVVGNHDDGNSTNNLFSEQYVYGYLLAPEETYDITRDDSGMYYYVDNPAERTRYLYLDTAYIGVNSNQQEFVKQALLSTPSGWHIVAISHIWYDTNYDVNPPTVGALNSGASILLSMFDNYNSRNGDYANCGGWVEFCIGGHTHRDYDGTSSRGIPIILIETDSQHVRSGLGFTYGTTTEACVNGIIANYDEKKISIVRIGRGSSREVEMTWYEVSYTNVLPTLVGDNGTSVYNGVGYKAGVRWSSSGNAESTASGIYLSGYIPLKKGDVVRLRNITMNKNTTVNNECTFWYFSAIGTHGGNITPAYLPNYMNTKFDDNGNLIEFTYDGNTDKPYCRLQCTYIGSDSIITINEEIPD